MQGRLSDDLFMLDYTDWKSIAKGSLMATKQMQVRDLGDRFPTVTLPSVHGDGEIDIASFRGKRLLVFSWSSW